jgi:hypothetical protein
MTREELITSDGYIKAISECIIRSGRSVKQMRKEMDEYLFNLRDEYIQIGIDRAAPVSDTYKYTNPSPHPEV